MPFGTSSQLGEALTAGQVGQLIQKRISPQIVDLFRRYSPLMSMIPTTPWDSTMYYWNQRRNLPPGGFVRDGGARPLGNSTWNQSYVPLANLQTVGSVSGFAQATTRSLIGDLFREEYDAASQGLVFDIETALSWGCAGATANGPWPQFDGLNMQVNQFSTSPTVPQNAIDERGNVLSLGMLDQLIDMVRTNAARPVNGQNYMLVMTSTALSKIEQLSTQYLRYVEKTEAVDAGMTVTAYKNIPIMMTSYLGSALGSPMPAVTATASATGGSLVAGTYNYVVVPVMARAGLGAPSVSVAATTTGTTGVVNLQFTPPMGPANAMPLLYEVYRGSAGAGSEVLLGIVDAAASLAADGITPNMTTGIADTGATLIPTWNAGTMVPPPGQFSPNYVGGTGQRPRQAPVAAQGNQLAVNGGEDIFLIPTDPDILVRPYVRDIQMVPVSATVNQPDANPFALVSDTALAVRAPQFVGRIRNCVAELAA